MNKSLYLLLMISLGYGCLPPSAPKRPNFAQSEDSLKTNFGELPQVESDEPSSTQPNPRGFGSDDSTESKQGENQPGIKTPDTFHLTLKAFEAAPKKGDRAVITIKIANSGSKSGKVKVTPLITSEHYSDWQNVKLPSFEVSLGGLEIKTAKFNIEPFFKEEDGKREYALNRGTYKIKFQVEGNYKGTWADREFKVLPSNAVFTAVLWRKQYLDKIGYTASINDWLKASYSRKSKTSDGGNLFATYDKGFDHMMNVRTMWKTFDNWDPNQNQMDHILDQVAKDAQQRIGLKQPFQGSSGSDMTHTGNHGYDLLVGLLENPFGGIAWIGGNAQVSGTFDNDLSHERTQMILIHETGHNYGADHCDPIQGFVMCSGEAHDHYKNGERSFVWHDVSIRSMNKAKNLMHATPTTAGARLNLTGSIGVAPKPGSCH